MGASGLLLEALTHLTRLVRGELALARSEVAHSAGQALRGIGFVLLAVILAVTAVNLIASTLVVVVARAGVAPHWAALLVAAGFALAAIIAIRIGLAALKPAQLVPTQALHGLMRDAETLKEGIRR